MDKSIKVEIAVGVILIIAVMIGGFAWLGKKQQQQIQTVTQPSKSQTAPSQPDSPPISDFQGADTDPGLQNYQDSEQSKAGSVPIESVKMDMSDSWSIKNLQNRMYIKDNNVKSSYDSSLVVSVKTTENDVTDMKTLQDEAAGTDFTDLKEGTIFKVPNCGALACFGAIIKDKIYSFNWDVQTNDPNPQNARDSFSADEIWNAMKTLTIE